MLTAELCCSFSNFKLLLLVLLPLLLLWWLLLMLLLLLLHEIFHFFLQFQNVFTTDCRINGNDSQHTHTRDH